MEQTRQPLYLLFFLVFFLGLVPPIFDKVFDKVIRDHYFMIDFIAFMWIKLALVLIAGYWVGRKLAIDLPAHLLAVLLTILGACLGSWTGLTLYLSIVSNLPEGWHLWLLMSSTIRNQFTLVFTAVSLAYFRSQNLLLLQAPMEIRRRKCRALN